MFRKSFLLSTVQFFILSACVGVKTHSLCDLAEDSARNFFQSLAAGDYQTAQTWFAGDYSELQYMNPDIKSEDHAVLWQNACEINGYQCLPIKQVLHTENKSNKEFRLTVEFENPDGSIFQLGPCCGASEEEMPSITQFEINVIEQAGRYRVTSLPVLVP